MKIARTIDELREARKDMGRVAFVPTMGALHSGHLSLMTAAKELADHVIVSIFVNPTQFGPNEDFDRYPRQLEKDTEACQSVGVDLLFVPTPDEMYPEGLESSTFVEVLGLTDYLCGASRPGHFRGVTTVVTKLFNAVQPQVAVFGQKDYQQAAVIARMTRELLMPIEIVAAPTARESDGLAMSSRNYNLSPEARIEALALSRSLKRAWSAFAAGESNGSVLVALTRDTLQEGLRDASRIDYVDCVDPVTLEPSASIGEEGAVMCVAAHVGGVRLIDNIRLDKPLPHELQ